MSAASLSGAPSGLLAEASDLLIAAGYKEVPAGNALNWPSPHVRVFEDAFGVVGVAVFDTWQQLVSDWPTAQASLVELLSEHLDAGEAKAWEGYLVLLTSGTAGGEREALEAIRYNVDRLRKIVADSAELAELGALATVLAPLLPLSADHELDNEPAPALELLRGELVQRRFDPEATARIIDAFEQQLPIVEALDEWRRSNASD